MQQLLRVLPDLRRVRAEREPETNKVRLHSRQNTILVFSMDSHQKKIKQTYEDEDGCTEIHQRLDCRLIERIGHRIRVLVVAMIADPQRIIRPTRRRRTASADQLELSRASPQLVYATPKIFHEVTHIPIRLIKQRRRQRAYNRHDEHHTSNTGTLRIEFLFLSSQCSAAHTHSRH